MSHDLRRVHVQPLPHGRHVRAEGEGDRSATPGENNHLVGAVVDRETAGFNVVGDEGGRGHVVEDVTLPTSSDTPCTRRHCHYGEWRSKQLI
jgi:hypothetical protein